MSKRQWGHGYWSGVYDASVGAVREKETIKDLTEKSLLLMAQFNESKEYDRSLFPVNQFIAYLLFCGYDRERATQEVKAIYDYTLNNMPFGCYITGGRNNLWLDDYFEISRLIRTWRIVKKEVFQNE